MGGVGHRISLVGGELRGRDVVVTGRQDDGSGNVFLYYAIGVILLMQADDSTIKASVVTDNQPINETKREQTKRERIAWRLWSSVIIAKRGDDLNGDPTSKTRAPTTARA